MQSLRPCVTVTTRNKRARCLSFPGGFEERILRRVAARSELLAHIPPLAATCSPAPECTDQGASEGHTALTLCMNTKQRQLGAVASADEAAADGVAGASMWLQKAAVTDTNVLNQGLFTLETRPGVVVCRLLARASALQGVAVCLPDCACLLLGPGTLKLQGATFQGGAVVCSGANCEATFEDAVFDGSLLVLSAAQATLSKAAFSNMEVSQSGLAVFVHGVSSRVAVRGGTVAGGTQAVAVQAGGHLEATGLTVTGVVAVGAEVQGEGSCLSLTGCEMHNFSEPGAEEGSDSEQEELSSALGVHVHSSSSAHLSYLSACDGEGVRVCSASATLDGCTLSQGDAGLHINEGTIVHATKRLFRQNNVGASAIGGATLTAVACTSSRNSFRGSVVSAQASVVELTDCASDSDGSGCEAGHGAALRATRVAVTNSRGAGYYTYSGGHMVLTDCSAESCDNVGVHASYEESKVHVEAARSSRTVNRVFWRGSRQRSL